MVMTRFNKFAGHVNGSSYDGVVEARIPGFSIIRGFL